MSRRKTDINEGFFESWSPNMAYVLGLWFADECMHSSFVRMGKRSGLEYRGYYFSLTLNKKDRDLIMAVAMSMGAYHVSPQTVLNSNCLMLRFCSKRIFDSLLKLGGKPRKSLIMTFPNVPDEYLPDFIRGYFDGDGCISSSGVRNPSLSISFCCGSWAFTTGLLERIRKALPGITGYVVKKHGLSNFGGKSKKTYETRAFDLKFSTNDTRRLVQFIYSGGSPLKMERKFLKALTVGFPKESFMEFEKARSVVRQLKLRTWMDWNSWSASESRPEIIPSNPYLVYKLNGWTGMRDWLGVEGPRRRQARCKIQEK